MKSIPVLKDFSSFYRYFIFINRADYNNNVYSNKELCVNDLKQNKGHSGSSLRQTILISNNRSILDTILSQRVYNGPSRIYESSNKSALSKSNNKVDRKPFLELQNDKTDIYSSIDESSFTNTLMYLYDYVGEGIFVKIKNGILVSFLPFLKTSDNILELIEMENKSPEFLDKINNKMSYVSIKFNCCNIETDSKYNYIAKKKYSMIKMYLLETIRYQNTNSPSKNISDVEFFINTSNCPILQENIQNRLPDLLAEDPNEEELDKYLLELNYFVKYKDKTSKNEYDAKIVDRDYSIRSDLQKYTISYTDNSGIVRELSDVSPTDISIDQKIFKFMPVLSISTTYNYVDMLMPPIEDWLTNLSINDTVVYSMNCNVKNKMSNSKWNNKKDMLLFRGYVDDCGMNLLTNRKLNIVYKGFDNDVLDAKLIRNRVSTEVFTISNMGSITLESLPEFIPLEDGENYLPMDQFFCNHVENIPFSEYHTYKYIIVCSSVIETPNYLKYFTTKSLIIKIKDKYTTWLDTYVKSFKWEQNLEEVGASIQDDSSIIKGANMIEIEVGELENLIEWCMNHPKMCEKIAENGFELLNNIYEDKVLLKDMAYTLEVISSKTHPHLRYEIENTKDDLYKCTEQVILKRRHIEYFKNNIPVLEQKTNTKIEIVPYAANADDIYVMVNGFEYNIYRLRQIVERDFTNIYEQVVDLPLNIKNITKTKNSKSVFMPDFIKKYKSRLEDHFNIIINEVSQDPSYKSWSLRGINSQGDIFKGKYTLKVNGSDKNINDFELLLDNTINDFRELNNFDLNIAVTTNKLLSKINYINIDDIIDDSNSTKYNKNTYIDTAYIIAYPDMPKEDFEKNVYAPVLKLLEEQDIKMDVVFVKQKINKKDYTEEEWDRFMNECYVQEEQESYDSDMDNNDDMKVYVMNEGEENESEDEEDIDNLENESENQEDIENVDESEEVEESERVDSNMGQITRKWVAIISIWSFISI